MFINLLLVGFGGFLGAIFRYASYLLASRFLPLNFAYATLFVNSIGSFMIGFVLSFIASKNFAFESEFKLFFISGFLGAFTTFSTFSYETISYFLALNLTLGFLNIFLNLILSLGFCTLGIFVFSLL